MKKMTLLLVSLATLSMVTLANAGVAYRCSTQCDGTPFSNSDITAEKARAAVIGQCAQVCKESGTPSNPCEKNVTCKRGS